MQVPLLLKMNLLEDALQKAVDSGDTDLGTWPCLRAGTRPPP
jgi:hypothetical protein